MNQTNSSQTNSQTNMYIGNLRRVNGLNKNSKRLPTADNPFKIKLKSHQEALLYRVLELDEKVPKTNLPFGIMSDKPGSGKTFVILALIYYSVKFFNSKGANIIVVPHNIYGQWIGAIDKFLGKLLRYNCLIDYKEINQLYTDSSILYNYDIIITTPIMYDVLAATVNSLNAYVRRVFFDEADSMKNLLVNAINSSMTWFISASISSVFDPVSLKAKIGKYELYLPSLLTNECWSESEFIDSNIKLPPPHIEKLICKDFYIDLMLSNILDSDQIKYINAHDYSNIRQECNNSIIKSNRELVRYLYEYSNKMISDANAVLKDLERNRVDAPDTRAKTLRKKQIYTQRMDAIKFLTRKYNICIQCFSHIENETKILNKSPCGDFICDNCWEAKPTVCMGCNKIHLLDTWVTENFSSTQTVKDFLSKSKLDKFVVLDSILEACGKKIIIYSEFRGLNNYLKNYSIDYKIKIEELNGGNIKEIDRILVSFRDDPDVKILLIDNAYFGVGLNIEYTTDMIFFHNVEDKLKTQLVGRAQRFGRKSTLNIWEIKYWNEDPEAQKNYKNKENNINHKNKTKKHTSKKSKKIIESEEEESESEEEEEESEEEEEEAEEEEEEEEESEEEESEESEEEEEEEEESEEEESEESEEEESEEEESEEEESVESKESNGTV